MSRPKSAFVKKTKKEKKEKIAALFYTGFKFIKKPTITPQDPPCD